MKAIVVLTFVNPAVPDAVITDQFVSPESVSYRNAAIVVEAVEVTRAEENPIHCTVEVVELPVWILAMNSGSHELLTIVSVDHGPEEAVD